MGADAPQDPQAQLDQELTSAEQAVAAVKDRVAGDLATLRDELEQQHSQAQQGQAIDLSTAISRIAAMTQAIEEIDLPAAEAPADPAPAEEPVDEPAAVGDQAVADEPAPEEPAAPASPAPVYTFDGDPSMIDPGTWQDAGLQTDDGRPLYHYQGDTPGQPAAGDGQDGVWHIYTGTQNAPPQPGQPGTPPPAPPAL